MYMERFTKHYLMSFKITHLFKQNVLGIREKVTWKIESISLIYIIFYHIKLYHILLLYIHTYIHTYFFSDHSDDFPLCGDSTETILDVNSEYDGTNE